MSIYVERLNLRPCFGGHKAFNSADQLAPLNIEEYPPLGIEEYPKKEIWHFIRPQFLFNIPSKKCCQYLT